MDQNWGEKKEGELPLFTDVMILTIKIHENATRA